MRTLSFVVYKQIMTQNPKCDFEGLVPGTEDYLQAEFSFSPDWDDYVKVAVFSSVMGKEYPPQILKDGKTCTIPKEALKKRVFKVHIVGRKSTTDNTYTRIATNKVTVDQNGGKV